MPEAAQSKPTTSLAARLVIGMSALLLVGGFVLSFAAYSYGRTAAREAFDRLLVGAANDIAASLTVEDGNLAVDLPMSAFELLGLAEDDRIAYQVIGPDGGIVTGYTNLPQPPSGDADQVLFDAEFTGEPARYISITRRFAERKFSGPVHIIVGQTKLARNQLAYSITRNALAGLTIGGIAMLVFAVIIVRRALQPLDRLAESLSARDPQDLTPIQTAVPKEVHGMVLAINGFMGRLDRQFDTMKRLISDTAHQLRTPVAGLRAQADLAASEPDRDTQSQIVARIHTATIRLSRLLDQMLSRALVIHRSDSARREPVDLRDIALDVFEDFSHRNVGKAPKLRLDIGDAPVIVMADTLSLTEAAKNLLSNALDHGVAPITIGVSEDRLRGSLWVEDSGSGPSEAVRAKIGQRFAAGASGAGLGLSIARSVAEAFGGAMKLANSDAGFVVSIDLPMKDRK